VKAVSWDFSIAVLVLRVALGSVRVKPRFSFIGRCSELP